LERVDVSEVIPALPLLPCTGTTLTRPERLIRGQSLYQATADPLQQAWLGVTKSLAIGETTLELGSQGTGDLAAAKTSLMLDHSCPLKTFREIPHEVVQRARAFWALATYGFAAVGTPV
jgi:hypothetical protein